MANPINGRNVVLYYHDDVLDEDIAFACATSCTLQSSTSLKEVTNINSAFYKEFKADVNSWQIQGSGLTILNTQWNYFHLIDQQLNRTSFTVKFVIDNGGALGLTIFSGEVIITSIEMTGNDDQLSTYTFSLQGTGSPSTSGTVVTPGGSIIISGTTLQVFQVTASGGETSITFPGAILLDAVYGSRGGLTFQPIQYAGTPTGNGGTWVTSTGAMTLPADNPAVAGEYFLILAQ